MKIFPVIRFSQSSEINPIKQFSQLNSENFPSKAIFPVDQQVKVNNKENSFVPYYYNMASIVII